jgi:FGGY-family pentulose kinase
MACSREPRFVGGVWGPYFSAMVPGYWLTEGGQSATGALVDHVISTHAASGELAKEAERGGRTIYELLSARLAALAGGALPRGSRPRGEAGIARLAAHRHVLPYFHGNRSPRANPALRGVIAGLRLDGSADELALTYLATIQGLACGTRHILEAMNQAGYRIETILACGGGTKNPLFIQAHADATGLPVALPREPEAVLLGSAILAAVAAGRYANVPAAMAAMSAAETVIRPDPALRDFYQGKYEVFGKMHDHWQSYERIMAGR